MAAPGKKPDAALIRAVDGTATPQHSSRSCPQCGTACSSSHQYCVGCGFPLRVVLQPGDPFIGKELPGGYQILDLIAVGGMGRVYRAEQRVLGRTVAVKVIHPHLLSDESCSARFLTEARAASQLNHPNSVAVFDLGRADGGQPYIVMEFLRGKDLARAVEEEGLIDLPRAVGILLQVLAALGEAHELGIVHRDMKPANVILERLRAGDDFVKVVDFGLAKLGLDAQAGVTTPGIVFGTPDYMAPEQGRGEPTDRRSDLYAVGVMLFELITGRLPFEAESPTDVVLMQIAVPPPDPCTLAPEREIPQALRDVCLKALAKSPDERHQSAAELADALEHAMRSASRATPLPSAETTQCGGCSQIVRIAKFCGECGVKLASKRPSLAETAVRPLVGREADMDWLERRRQSLHTGIAGCLVVGEPGVGKSRLLAELAQRASAEGERVVMIGPDPWWAEAAYWTLRRAIRDLAELDQATIEARHFPGAYADAKRGLQQIFDSVIDSAQSARADRRSPPERRIAVAEALRWALMCASAKAEPGRVLLLVDELHRVDAPSRAAIADVVNEPLRGARTLVVAARAPGFDVGWGQANESRVLAGLDRETVALVWGTSLGDRGAGTEPDVLPLYAEQLARFSREGGSDPPERLPDLIARRVDALEPNARRVLQALAVLGDRADLDTIDRIVPFALDAKRALEVLLSAGMVEREGKLVSTSHPLLRELVLAGTPAAVRRELHSRALAACEQLDMPIEAQAQHACEAQEAFQALLLLEQLADRARTRADRSTEIHALRRGLEIARREISRGDLDDPLRAVLIFSRKLATALARGGDLADADGVLREALDVAGPGGADRAQVLGSLAQIAHQRRRSLEAIAYIDQAIEAARQSREHELVTQLSGTRRAWAS
jgi:serine/threonine protein kinase/tetratricopeptide (TPR) repeat protein